MKKQGLSLLGAGILVFSVTGATEATTLTASFVDTGSNGGRPRRRRR